MPPAGFNPYYSSLVTTLNWFPSGFRILGFIFYFKSSLKAFVSFQSLKRSVLCLQLILILIYFYVSFNCIVSHLLNTKRVQNSKTAHIFKKWCFIRIDMHPMIDRLLRKFGKQKKNKFFFLFNVILLLSVCVMMVKEQQTIHCINLSGITFLLFCIHDITELWHEKNIWKMQACNLRTLLCKKNMCLQISKLPKYHFQFEDVKCVWLVQEWPRFETNPWQWQVAEGTRSPWTGVPVTQRTQTKLIFRNVLILLACMWVSEGMLWCVCCGNAVIDGNDFKDPIW